MTGRALPVSILSILLAGCGAGHAAPTTGPASACASCHEALHADWADSAHARSGQSPEFQHLLAQADAQWGAGAAAQCVGCHQPDDVPGEAITCVSCHQTELDLRDPELCGRCHEVNGPGGFVEPTLTEFLASPQAKQGVVCVDCHDPHRLGIDEATVAFALTVHLTGERLIVANTGAAHSVPTGATFFREIWIELEGRRVMTLDPPLEAGTSRETTVSPTTATPVVRYRRFRSPLLLPELPSPPTVR